MYLKDVGDRVTVLTDDDRNKVTVAMIEVALMDEDDDADQVMEKTNFVQALHTLGMVRSDSIISIVK
jgi:hypothetical protein